MLKGFFLTPPPCVRPCKNSWQNSKLAYYSVSVWHDNNEVRYQSLQYQR